MSADAFLCPQCGADPGACPHRGPWPGEEGPPNRQQPDPVIGMQEKRLRFATTPEAGAIIVIDQREGFIPCLFWIGFSQDTADETPPPLIPVRIDLVADDPNLGLGQDLPAYVLVNNRIRFFTLLSQAYHGIPVPLLGGQAQPYKLRCFSQGQQNRQKQLAVQWGYRAIDKRSTGVAGAT